MSGGPGMDKDKRAEFEKNKGNEAFKNGNWQEALTHFTCVRIAPNATAV